MVVDTDLMLSHMLYVGPSSIHGSGVFALHPLCVDEVMGVSHLEIGADVYRLALGNFLNHSDDPNVTYAEKPEGLVTKYYVCVIRPVFAGEELTVSYGTFSRPPA